MNLNRTLAWQLAILVGVYAVLHLLIIHVPKEPIFDEVYYANSAKAVLGLDGELRPEHPPLAQLIVTAGVALFGWNPLGWRSFSVLFGALTLVVFYLLVRYLTNSQPVAFATSLTLSFSNLFFIFSLIGMLDIFFLFFLTTAFYMLARSNFMSSASNLALAAVSKLTAGFFIPAVAVYFAVMRLWRRERWGDGLWVWPHLLLWLGVFVLSFMTFLYVFDQFYAGYGLLGIAFRSVPSSAMNLPYYSDPASHILHMLTTHTSSNWPTLNEPPPWEWILVSQNYYLGRLSLAGITLLEGLNPALMGLVILSAPMAVYSIVVERDRASLIAFLWFAFAYFPWIGIHFMFARPLFHFYILAAVPAICMMNVQLLAPMKRVLWLYVLLNGVFFLVFQYPFKALS